MTTNWRRRIYTGILLVMLGAPGATAQDRNFTPVTDAMLANPDPADWLNWRRTLDAWGYSPLDQVTQRTCIGCSLSGHGRWDPVPVSPHRSCTTG